MKQTVCKPFEAVHRQKICSLWLILVVRLFVLVTAEESLIRQSQESAQLTKSRRQPSGEITSQPHPAREQLPPLGCNVAFI